MQIVLFPILQITIVAVGGVILASLPYLLHQEMPKFIWRFYLTIAGVTIIVALSDLVPWYLGHYVWPRPVRLCRTAVMAVVIFGSIAKLLFLYRKHRIQRRTDIG